MKNTLKILGIIALAMVIGFSMTACDTGGDDNGGGGGGGGSTPAQTITITNIPATSIGSYIALDTLGGNLTGSDWHVVGVANNPTTNTWSRSQLTRKPITGSTVTLTSFQNYGTAGTGDFYNYTGSETFNTKNTTFEGVTTVNNQVRITITSQVSFTATGGTSYNAAPVVFSNGSATIDYSTFVVTSARQ